MHPWRYDIGKKMMKDVTEAIDALRKYYLLPLPKQTDTRYPSYKSEASRWDIYRIYHFCLWKQAGHNEGDPALSKDLFQTGEKLNYVREFYRHIAPLIQTI